MIYLDTSYIVKCYLGEPGSSTILAWLEGKTGLACCVHGRLEFAAAVHRHVQERRLSAAQSRTVARLLDRDERDGLWEWLPVSDRLVREACARLSVLPTAVHLRAADALHLTCAAAHGCRVVYSHDRHLLAAAPVFGIRGEDILAAP